MWNCERIILIHQLVFEILYYKVSMQREIPPGGARPAWRHIPTLVRSVVVAFHYKFLKCILQWKLENRVLCQNVQIQPRLRQKSCFFLVPMEVKMRKKWIKAMKRVDPFGDKSKVYCCEDHFDVSIVMIF